MGGWMVTDLARKLRRQATPAEQAFWKLSYTWRQDGWHFRRQFQLGSYYVDFACISAGLSRLMGKRMERILRDRMMPHETITSTAAALS